MKTFIFIPDTNKKAGLGHLFRCFKYSNFVNPKYEIIFLVKKNFSKKYLIKKNFKNIKIKYIFFSNLHNVLNSIKKKYEYVVTFLDTYNSNIRNINFKEFSKKHINILDFKTKCNSDHIIDHTFGRKYNYHGNKKILIGVKNFPICSKLKFQNRNIILINFGSIKNKNLIKKSLILIKNIKLNKSIKIVIINKFYSKKDSQFIKLENKIIHYKFITNIEKLYQKTLFSIGACGISLYERCFYNIPCVSKSVALNQSYNFKNFLNHNCILDFDKIVSLSLQKSINHDKFLNKTNKIEKNLKKYFDYKKNIKHLNKVFNRF